MLDLEPIKAREAAATSGPWVYDKGIDEIISKSLKADYIYIAEITGRNHDGLFIAHARSDILALIAEVERLRKKKEK